MHTPAPHPENDETPPQLRQVQQAQQFAPEELPFVREMEEFIERFSFTFCAIAGDRGMRFVPGRGFFINLETKQVTLDIADWKQRRERGMSTAQVLWSVCHEIGHLRDLHAESKEMLSHFRYLQRRAREIAPKILEIWMRRFGTLPEHLTRQVPVGKRGSGETMSGVEQFVYQQLHSLYNALDDIFVNRSVPQFAAPFRSGGSWGEEPERLYRDFLFPTDPKHIGIPPSGNEPVDYAELALPTQFWQSLLRRAMVPQQPVLVSEPVRACLDEPRDGAAAELGLLFRDEILGLLAPGGRGANPAWRYAQIKKLVEPVFVDFLLQDVESKPLPPPPKSEKGQGGGEPQEGQGQIDPWAQPNDFHHAPDIEDAKDMQDKRDAKARADKKRDKQDQRGAAEKQEDAQKQIDADALVREGAATPAEAQRIVDEYYRTKHRIDQHRRKLGTLFEQLLRTIQQKVVESLERGFRSGKLSVPEFIRKHSAELAAGREADIPWPELTVYLRNEPETRISLQPNEVRVRLVLDGSGSMNAERIAALKDVYVLLLEGLATFESTVNHQVRLQKPFAVDTEVRVFGSQGNSEALKELRRGKSASKRERAERLAAFGKLGNDRGTTWDAEPWEQIARGSTAADAERIRRGELVDLAFEITDGGSDNEEATRIAVEGAREAGVECHAFQIGGPSEGEKQTFRSIWGESGNEVPEIGKLADAVSAQLAEFLERMRIRVSAAGGDPDEIEDDH